MAYIYISTVVCVKRQEEMFYNEVRKCLTFDLSRLI
jgi:hypothetical protein